MASESPSEREFLRQALGPGKDCMPIDELEQLLQSDAPPVTVVQHVEACPYCRTELDLLRVFQAGPRDESESESVRLVAERLRPTFPEITPEITPDALPWAELWWKSLFNARWLSPAAIAMAGVLMAVAVGVQWRHGTAPALSPLSEREQEVFRSGSFSVTAPVGDIGQVPKEILWQPVQGAAHYQVLLLEVDRTELWKSTTAETRLDLPVLVQAKIVPAKTLLLQITALDSLGRVIAQSEQARFRILQKVYTR